MRSTCLVSAVILLLAPRAIHADSFQFTLIGSSSQNHPAINNLGFVAYSDQGSIRLGDGTIAIEVARTGALWSCFDPAISVNDSNTVTFAALRTQGGQNTIWTSEGTEIAGGNVGGAPDINNDGLVLWTSVTNGLQIYDTTDGTNEPLSAWFGGTYGYPAFNDFGTIAVAGYRNETYGVYSVEGSTVTKYIDDTGPLSGFSFPAINNEGDVLFRANIKEGGNGLYLWDGSAIQTVASTPATYPGGFGPTALNDNGWVSYTASDDGTAWQLYLWDGATATRVIGEGDILFGSEVTALRSSSRGLNNGGQITFRAVTETGSYIVRADPIAEPTPEPIPEPSSLELLSMGLAGLITWLRKEPS